MAIPRLLQLLHRAGWEFWLPLPLIALSCWVAGNILVGQVFRRPYGSVDKLEAAKSSEVKLSVAILAIQAEIDRDRGVTTIFVKSTDLNWQKLKYQLPTTRAVQVEVVLAQQLNIPVETIQKLISYRIKDSRID